MNPEQWLSLKWNGGSTMSDRWLNQSKIIHCNLNKEFLIIYRSFNTIIFIRHNKEEQMNKSTLFCYALYLFKYFRTKQL